MSSKLSIVGSVATLSTITDVRKFRLGLNFVVGGVFFVFYAFLELFSIGFGVFGIVARVLLVILFFYWLIFFPGIDDDYLKIKHDKSEGRLYVGNGNGGWIMRDIGAPKCIIIYRTKNGYVASLIGDSGSAIISSTVSRLLPGKAKRILEAHLRDYAAWLDINIEYK